MIIQAKDETERIQRSADAKIDQRWRCFSHKIAKLLLKKRDDKNKQSRVKIYVVSLCRVDCRISLKCQNSIVKCQNTSLQNTLRFVLYLEDSIVKSTVQKQS